MDTLTKEIERIQRLLLTEVKTDVEMEEVSVMVLRFARFLSSPSKLNAYSVLMSNDATKLATLLSYWEGTL